MRKHFFAVLLVFTSVAFSGAQEGPGGTARVERRVGSGGLVTDQSTASATISQEKYLGLGVGFNTPDLFKEYLGSAFGAQMPPFKLARAMARKTLADASRYSHGPLRFMASGYSAWELGLWMKNPEAHWRLFDLMLADFKEFGLKAVPIINWHLRQFPDLAGESVGEFLVNPSSRSRTLFRRYLSELVGRYKDSEEVLFWELTNEWNLYADIDTRQIFGWSSADNYSTDQLIRFSWEAVGEIRGLDSRHLVSSGYSLSPRHAEHLRRRPMWGASPDFGDDSILEFTKNLWEIHGPFDVVSIHFYNGLEWGNRRGNERFGHSGRYNADLLDLVYDLVKIRGKILYVGEFNDVDPTIWGDMSSPFSINVLEKIRTNRILFASHWAFEFYQHSMVDHQPGLSIEPGLYGFDHLLGKVRQTNEILGVLKPRELGLDNPPIIIINTPFDQGRVVGVQLVSVLASDDTGVEKVQLWLDGQLASTLFSAPYRWNIDFGSLTEGAHELMARAFDRAGNQSEFLVTVNK